MNTDRTYPKYTDGGGLAYYEGPDIADGLLHALSAAELDPNALDIDDLSALDEFHALGRAATVALAELASVQPGDRVLDIGAGIGGPARFLAARRGARVTALDATPRFCSAADLLTRGAGLSDRVTVVCGDALALPFADGSFDLAWSQAVTQNIADKRRFIAEAARVVRPGGQVALFELAAGPGGPLELPVPWADRDDQSWLVSSGELRELLDGDPLELVAFNETQATLATIAEAAASLPAVPAHRHLGLDILMPDYEQRMAAVGRNIAQDRIALVQAVLRRCE